MINVMAKPRLVSVNISSGGIPKMPQERADVTPEGLSGDGHDHEKHNTPLQAISLIDLEDLHDMHAEESWELPPGAVGENFTVEGVGVDELQIADRLVFSGGVAVELTKVRKPCYVLDSIHPRVKQVIRGRCGFYARVLRTGSIAPGETIEIIPADR
jgi:MOSC domain-containing protein YiiM